MDYYFLTNSTNEKEVGHYIQCKGIPDGYTYNIFNSNDSMTKLTNEEFPKNNPFLLFELEKEAILTDIVSPSNIMAEGLLVNEKTKKIIEQCNLPEHKFYPATIIVNNIKHKYFWLHLVDINFSLINISESIFYLSEFGDDKGEYVKFNNYQEALKIREEKDCSIKIEKLTLYCNYDILFLNIPNRIIINTHLLNILKKNTIKGYDVELLH